MKKLCRMALICIVMLFCGLAFSVSVQAKEANARIEPRIARIYTYGTELSISSGGVASISGFVRGKSGVTSTYVKVTLQKSVSGEWVDVKSWDESNDTRSTSVTETYQVSHGTYRVNMTCSADGETETATSAERTY